MEAIQIVRVKAHVAVPGEIVGRRRRGERRRAWGGDVGRRIIARAAHAAAARPYIFLVVGAWRWRRCFSRGGGNLKGEIVEFVRRYHVEGAAFGTIPDRARGAYIILKTFLYFSQDDHDIVGREVIFGIDGYLPAAYIPLMKA